MPAARPGTAPAPPGKRRSPWSPGGLQGRWELTGHTRAQPGATPRPIPGPQLANRLVTEPIKLPDASLFPGKKDEPLGSRSISSAGTPAVREGLGPRGAPGPHSTGPHPGHCKCRRSRERGWRREGQRLQPWGSGRHLPGGPGNPLYSGLFVKRESKRDFREHTTQSLVPGCAVIGIWDEQGRPGCHAGQGAAM